MASTLGPRSCGGTVRLGDSLPHFMMDSPYYNKTPSATKTIRCYWYLISDTDEKVQVEWLDVDLGMDYVDLYDHPTSSSYGVSMIQGSIGEGLSPVVSSRGGFVLRLTDGSSPSRGFRARISLRGKIIIIVCIDSPNAMYPNLP